VTQSEPGTGIEPGLRGELEFEVDDRVLTDVGGSLSSPVLSTPSMVGMMEWAATKVVNPRLPEGSVSVGFEVCIKHVAVAGRGAQCTARATLREVVDGRKLYFDVEVVEGDRVIGLGTHQRRVVDIRGS
jgi:fluoroacetyl-CoA thioesterase